MSPPATTTPTTTTRNTGNTIGLCAIPPEILSELFEIGKLCEDKAIADNKRPSKPFELLVTQISSHLRKIALATPRLWSSIRATPTSSLERVTEYTARSAQAWLDIRLDMLQISSAINEEHQDAVLNIITPHSDRWRRLSVAHSCERASRPAIGRLSACAAPGLQHLSITVNDVDGVDSSVANSDIRSPHIFKAGTPKLTFIRLRGLAMHLFRPSLEAVVTLHLDETEKVPLTYTRFHEILTCSPSLTHLSIYGDIIPRTDWPHRQNVIQLPALQSLRICGVSGEVYSGILIGVDAPNLESLTLKDLQEHDLDPLSDVLDMSKYTSLKSLKFCDFEVSAYTYERIMRIFRNITTFSSLHSPISDSRLVDVFLGSSMEAGEEPQWPMLHTLSFPLNLEGNDEEVVEELVAARQDDGHPVSKISLRVSADEGQNLTVEAEVHGTRVVIFSGQDTWPRNSGESDQDDIFLH